MGRLTPWERIAAALARMGRAEPAGPTAMRHWIRARRFGRTGQLGHLTRTLRRLPRGQ